MTLTLTAIDSSQEATDFFAQVARLQGHVTGMTYRFSKSPALCEFTAYYPEQPELIPNETKMSIPSLPSSVARTPFTPQNQPTTTLSEVQTGH